MLEKVFKNKFKIGILLVLTLLLIGIRAYEEELFYDPFLLYFRGDYMGLKFPKFDSFQLFLNLSLRYFLNTITSLMIIHVLFLDFRFTKFISILYVFLFLVLIVSFFSILIFFDKESNFVLFYIRRFLIQPLFLLLFIPAFFYQKQNK